MTYGQTNSGKTYTILGDIKNEKNSGILPRTVDYFFDKIESMP